MALTHQAKQRLIEKQLGRPLLSGLKRLDATLDRTVMTPNSTLPVYVLNTNYIDLDAQSGVIRTAVVITIHREDGGDAVPIKIPATWVPINVTAQVPKHLLLNSIDFRQSLSAGELILVDPTTAQKVMENEAAQEAYQRAMSGLSDKSEAIPENAVATSTAELAEKFGKVNPQVADNRSEEDKLAAQCSPGTVNFVSRITSLAEENKGTVPVDEVVDHLFANGDTMKSPDLELFARQLVAKFPSLKENEEVRSELDKITRRIQGL